MRVLVVAREQMTAERTRVINTLIALVRTIDLGVDARRPLTGRQVSLIAGAVPRRSRPAASLDRGAAGLGHCPGSRNMSWPAAIWSIRIVSSPKRMGRFVMARVQAALPPRGRSSGKTIGIVTAVVVAIIGGIFAVWAAFIERGPLAPPGETATLVLAPNVVENDGKKYRAEASGFEPNEVVRFSWATGPDDKRNAINDTKADASGTTQIEVTEGAAPGMYIIFANGMRSGRVATATLQVIAA